MDTTHALFDIAAFDRLEESTPRVYLKALADAFGSDARLGDLLLAATEAELADRWEIIHEDDEIKHALTQAAAVAAGLEAGSQECWERECELRREVEDRVRKDRAEWKARRPESAVMATA